MRQVIHEVEEEEAEEKEGELAHTIWSRYVYFVALSEAGLGLRVYPEAGKIVNLHRQEFT